MKPRTMIIPLIGLAAMLVAAPAMPAQGDDTSGYANQPLSANLVREGEFAVKLLNALEPGSTDDEIEAESRLGDLGIIPRNGWIADYPVTPDVLGEIRKSLTASADAGNLDLDREQALQRFETVNAEFNMQIRPESGTAAAKTPPPVAEETIINNYYYEHGPPVVTYYRPPPDYYYLYGWVPYPFWWSGIWFPGYFILNDFHTVVVVRKHVHFISNHFNDRKHQRAYRIDPVHRYKGKTYAGIGVSHRKDFISTGVPQSSRTIFNAPRGGRSGQELRGADSGRDRRHFVPSKGGGGSSFQRGERSGGSQHIRSSGSGGGGGRGGGEGRGGGVGRGGGGGDRRGR